VGEVEAAATLEGEEGTGDEAIGEVIAGIAAVLGAVETTTRGVSGTLLVGQGVMMVIVASLQVEGGSSILVRTSVQPHSISTNSVAKQVTVVVHQSHIGRLLGDGDDAGAEEMGGLGGDEGGLDGAMLDGCEAGADTGALDIGTAAAARPAKTMPDAAIENFITNMLKRFKSECGCIRNEGENERQK
jgi:hypothetical protein